MLKNYLKTAWQNLRKHPSYVAINAFGLAIGIAACLLIYLLVEYETSFDNFHTNRERIYRLTEVTKTANGLEYSGGTALPVAEALRNDYPHLEHIARIYQRQNQQVAVVPGAADQPEKKFREHVFFAEPDFFEMYNFPFLAGTAQTALSNVNTAILSRSAAEKYFGNWHTAVGKSIRYGTGKLCKITGVIEDVPANTDFPLQVVLSFKTAADEDLSTNWGGADGSLNTFVTLPQNVSADQFNYELRSFVQKHAPPEFSNHGYQLQSLGNMHFESRFGIFQGSTFSKSLITGLSLTGLFLLLIGCINFINLATVQAINRSKEVGVRKVLGSSKAQLVVQFLGETFLITLTSVVLAILLAFIALPSVNQFLQLPLRIKPGISFFTFIAIVVIIVTFLSGLYPAFILSRFNPNKVLKSKVSGTPVGGLSIRKVLVVFQFAVAQALILATIIVARQMDFFQHASLGFNKDAVVVVPLPNDTARSSKLDVLKLQLQQQPGIKNVSVSSFSPIDQASWDSDFKFDNAAKNTGFKTDLKWADNAYFKTYDIRFIAGQAYNNADTITGFVVNALMVKKLGIKDPADILGKRIAIFDGAVSAPVVGVVKDFYGASLKDEIRPTALASFGMVYRLLNIKIQPRDAQHSLAVIDSLWSSTYPNFLYEYHFLDDTIAGYYAREQQLATLFKISAAIAIFISCLGLYGFVSFVAVQRTKEVAVRKVLGASVLNIIYLFSKEFILLIAFAFLIATPVAYFLMHRWLENYANRINIGLSMFLYTILAAELIALLTVGYQALKAAIANPVRSLVRE